MNFDAIAIAHMIEDWIIAVFNKEGLAIFVLFCIMIFVLASMTAFWAIRNGEFTDMESSKFDPFEEGDEEKPNLIMGY